MKYDFLVIGAGICGSTIASKLHEAGKKVLVIDKRNNVGGNIYTENIEGINVHKYGAHIFHTDYDDVWDFVNRFVEFNRFTNCPIARIGNEIYNMPFNMNTFVKIWPDVFTPYDAMKKIEEEKNEMNGKEPSNLEEQAISLVGRTIYEKLIKGYTEKQWNRNCNELPAFIIKRLPVRFTFDNNYFDDKYQGIPVGGYTLLIEKILDGIDVKLNENFFEKENYYRSIADKIIYTGPIDEYFKYSLGSLEYRSLKFETKIYNQENYQGNAVVNYTGHEEKFTRVIEHKHFENSKSSKTVVTYEYPCDYEDGMEKYYTINDDKNNKLASEYLELANKEKNVIFVGRLAEYKYYDMDDVIKKAFDVVEKLI